MARISVRFEGNRAVSYELTKSPMTVGRSRQADVCLEGAAISRLHARFERSSDGNWTLRDLGSTNGVRLGEQAIRWSVLRDGDVVHLGNVRIVFSESELSDANQTVCFDASGLEVSEGGKVLGRRRTEDVPLRDTRYAVTPVEDVEADVRTGRRPSIAGDVHAWGPSVTPVAYGESTEDEPDGVGLSQTISQIWRYKGSVLLTFLVVAAVAVPLVRMFVVPKYRAVSEVLVRPIIPRIVFKTDDNGVIPLYQSYLNTQVAQIKSPTVLQRVLDQPEVKGTTFYTKIVNAPGGSLGTLLEVLRDTLEVESPKNTHVIQIAMPLDDPKNAAVIANAVLDQYIKFANDSSLATDDKVYAKLIDEEKTLRQDIEGRQKVVDRLRKELGTGAPEELVAQKRLRCDEMEAKLRGLQKDIRFAEWQKKDVESALKQDAKSSTQPAETVIPFFESDAEWVRRSEELKGLQGRMAEEQRRLGDGHPEMQNLKDRIDRAEKDLRHREEQLMQRGRSPISLLPSQRTGDMRNHPAMDQFQIRQNLERLKYEEQLLTDELKKERESYERIFEAATMLSKEAEAIARLKELYKAVRERLDQKMIERNVPGSIEPFSRAIVPQKPDKDKRMQLTIAAILGAMAAGVGLGLLRAKMTPAFHEADDVSRIVHAPFLGQLPYVREVEGLPLLETANQIESVRMLRTILLQRLPRRGDGHVVLVTGATPGCGKTTLSILLARTLAESGKNVLLVDTDLRKSSLSSRFGLEKHPGLINSLKGRLPDEQTIVHLQNPQFGLLPVGTHETGAGPELLANGLFESSLKRWRRQFDIVLLDTAPLGPVADGSIVSRHADGAIMVVREQHCRRENVTGAFHDLVASGGRLLGTVFIGSGQRRRQDGRYPQYYGYGYGAVPPPRDA